MAIWAERDLQSGVVSDTGRVVEDMKQSTVDNGVEGLAERDEVERVDHPEAGIDAARGRLAAGGLDGASGDVDTAGVGAVERGEEGVFAGAASGVEQCAGQRASLGEANERGLRAADVPRRWRAGVGVIPFR